MICTRLSQTGRDSMHMQTTVVLPQPGKPVSKRFFLGDTANGDMVNFFGARLSVAVILVASSLFSGNNWHPLKGMRICD